VSGPGPAAGGPEVGQPFRACLSGLLLLSGIFYANFTARLLLAPLLPTVEADLGLDHAEAGSLFLYLSIGYFTSLVL
jgi:NNP family nitrate/nitrite transporter-like MFS transporter